MKKETIKKEKATPKLVSYTMTAIIRIGQYENIQPAITVQAGTMDEARDFVMPHINELYKKYHNISESMVEIKPSVKVTPKPEVTTAIASDAPAGPAVYHPAPAPDVEPTVVSNAYSAAENAITRCTKLDDLGRLHNRIHDSKILKEDEKTKLDVLMLNKETEIKYITK